jgi:hypothetical protein
MYKLCEFGACGDIGFGFQQGSASNYPFTFWKSVGELAGMYDFYANLWHVGKYHANAHQVTYEDWCGPGGSGPNLSEHDAACHVHDVCYDTNGLHVLDNFNPNLPANKASALQGCNQQLCNATRGSLVDKYFSGPWFAVRRALQMRAVQRYVFYSAIFLYAVYNCFWLVGTMFSYGKNDTKGELLFVVLTFLADIPVLWWIKTNVKLGSLCLLVILIASLWLGESHQVLNCE